MSALAGMSAIVKVGFLEKRCLLAGLNRGPGTYERNT